MRPARRVLREPCKLWVRARSGEYPSIAFSQGPPTLTLKRTGDDRRPAARGAGVDDLINKINKLVGKPNGDLLAHPKMVSNW